MIHTYIKKGYRRNITMKFTFKMIDVQSIIFYIILPNKYKKNKKNKANLFTFCILYGKIYV